MEGYQLLPARHDGKVTADIPVRISVISAIAVFGLATNILNCLVLVKQGVRDCMSVCFISLTLTDFAAAVCGLLTMVCNVTMGISVNLDLRSIYYVLYRFCAMFYSISTLITAFISLERCFCVSMPFQFRSFMTMKRAILVVVILHVYSACIYMPFFFSVNIKPINSQDTNETSPESTWITPERTQVALFVITAIQFTVEPFCLLVITISTYFMIAHLRRSSQLRSRHARYSTKQVPGGRTRGSTTGDSTMAVDRHCSNHRTVSKTVVTLAIVSLTCNSVRYVIVVMILTFPEVDSSSEFKSLFFLLLDSIFLLQTTNVSAHVFVFNAFNIQFRRTFQRMFCSICTQKRNK